MTGRQTGYYGRTGERCGDEVSKVTRRPAFGGTVLPKVGRLVTLGLAWWGQ